MVKNAHPPMLKRKKKVSSLYQPFEKACGTMAQKIFPDGIYVLQQDGALSYGAEKTQLFLRDNMANILSKNFWPSRSQNLNLLDYSIWSVVESMACKKGH